MSISSTEARLTVDPAVARRSANTIRKFSVEQVHTAGTGHYGFPLGAADLADELFTRYLRYDGSAPQWPNRDRFVLSAGHGSSMLYSVLHLAGYDLGVEDLRAFRTLHSRTPGHPERGETDGVEVTTGPLGQGVANGVGLAIAESMLRASLGDEVIDHRTVVLASDGDLMEGVSYEAASLAGTLKLDRLVVLYDDNDIVIDSDAASVMSAEGTTQAFGALGWRVVTIDDGHDRELLRECLDSAWNETDGRPTLVRVRTTIGHGSPQAGTSQSHSGAPSGEELRTILAGLDLGDLEPFEIPADVAEHWRELQRRQRDRREEWELEHAPAWHAHVADLENAQEDAAQKIMQLPPETTPKATRASSGRALAQISGLSTGIVGGSADLAGATNAVLGDGDAYSPARRAGANIRFGVREHAMGAIANGITAHSTLRGLGATFLMFATYEANAIRMSALQGLGAIHVFSHDSILVGEDGPTHQPVEVLPFLRAIPDLDVWRPADDFETRAVWSCILREDQRPAAVILSRSEVDQIAGSRTIHDVTSGGYVVVEESDPEIVCLATGTEVTIAVRAALRSPHRVRVVSIPHIGRFRTRAPAELSEIMPAEVPRVCVEASSPMSWFRLAREHDTVIGVEGFGGSAAAADLAAEHGITEDALVEAFAHAIR